MLLKKRAEKTAVILLQIGDLILVFLSFLLAWYLRFEVQIIPLSKEWQPLEFYFLPIVVVSIIWVLVFAYRRVYILDLSVSFGKMVERIFWSSILATAIPMIIAFLYRQSSYARFMLAIGTVISFLVIVLYHRIVILVLRKMIEKGVIASKKLIIGAGNHAFEVIEHFEKTPMLRSGIVGCLKLNEHSDKMPKDKIIGKFSDLKDILINGDIDEVILAEPNCEDETIHRTIYECRKEKVLFAMVPVFQDLLSGDIIVDQVGSVSMLLFRDVAATKAQRIIKRLFDLLVSTILIILTLPLFVLTAVAIKLESRGPIFFTQTRIGRNGRYFKMIKFRSMYKDADKLKDELMEQNEVGKGMFKIKQDPRITKVGHFIRKFSIDELPQIYNVFAGHMSLVGPRPTIEKELKEYEKWQLKRIDTIPGMTGLWQVSGRSDLPFEKMVELDIYYIENWSLWLDFNILLKTIPAVLSGRGAY
ncbi:MAG: sugar transferase [Candidatus Zixiibacteriota bacterium]